MKVVIHYLLDLHRDYVWRTWPLHLKYCVEQLCASVLYHSVFLCMAFCPCLFWYSVIKMWEANAKQMKNIRNRNDSKQSSKLTSTLKIHIIVVLSLGHFRAMLYWLIIWIIWGAKLWTNNVTIIIVAIRKE